MMGIHSKNCVVHYFLAAFLPFFSPTLRFVFFFFFLSSSTAKAPQLQPWASASTLAVQKGHCGRLELLLGGAFVLGGGGGDCPKGTEAEAEGEAWASSLPLSLVTAAEAS